MSERITHAHVIAAIDRERSHWENLAGDVGRERMDEPGVMGEWTFKDLAVHITAWQDHNTRALEAEIAGQPVPKPVWPETLDDEDYDSINAWFRDENDDRSLDDVLHDASDAYRRVADAVGKLSEDELNDAARFYWTGGKSLGDVIVNGPYFGHLREEHEQDVLDFIARSN